MWRRFLIALSTTSDRLGLPGGDFVRGSTIIALGTGASQVIVVATAPIITRLFVPAEFGAYSVALSLIAILGVLATMVYDEAIPLPESHVGAANLVALCILISLGLSALMVVVLVPTGPALLDLVGAAELAPYAVLLALALVATGAVSAFIGWAIRMKAYSEIALNRLTSSTVMVVTQITLGALAWGAAGLLIGVVLAAFVAAARLAIVAIRNDSEAFRGVSRSGVRSVAQRYRRFPLLSAPATVMNTVGLQAPLLLIVALFGVAIGGQFALAHRVMAVPLTLVASAIAKTYFAEAARIARDEPEALRGHYVRTTRSLALITIVPITLAALLSPFLFGLVFGEEWREAGVFAMLLAPMYFLQLITNPTHGTLGVLERQDLHLQREIGRMLFLGIAIAIAWVLSVEAVWAVALIGVAGVLTYSWYGVTTWRAIVAHDRARVAQADAAAAAPEPAPKDPGTVDADVEAEQLPPSDDDDEDRPDGTPPPTGPDRRSGTD